MNDHEATPRADQPSAAVEGESEASDRLARRPWPAAPIRQGIDVSFEFFPPATPAGEDSLAQCVAQLAPLGPKFVSVTYGAGGTTQDRTHGAIRRLSAVPGLAVAGHLTSVGATKLKVAQVVDSYLRTGVRHIVALRGDAPAGQPDEASADGYESAADLVAGIRRHVDDLGVGSDFEISVGAYPEVHPKAASASADLDNLKRKLDAGATRAITQFFFEADTFLRFLDRARAAGIDAPIIPGIMPVTNFANVARFSARCGTTVPPWMHDLLGDLDEMPDVQPLVAATVAAEQCRRLAEHGVRDFHFYTMNRSELTAATCRILGLKAEDRRQSNSRMADLDAGRKMRAS